MTKVLYFGKKNLPSWKYVSCVLVVCCCCSLIFSIYFELTWLWSQSYKRNLVLKKTKLFDGLLCHLRCCLKSNLKWSKKNLGLINLFFLRLNLFYRIGSLYVLCCCTVVGKELSGAFSNITFNFFQKKKNFSFKTIIYFRALVSKNVFKTLLQLPCWEKQNCRYRPPSRHRLNQSGILTSMLL